MATSTGIAMCGDILPGVAVGVLIQGNTGDVVDLMVDANKFAVVVAATATVDTEVTATTTVMT